MQGSAIVVRRVYIVAISKVCHATALTISTSNYEQYNTYCYCRELPSFTRLLLPLPTLWLPFEKTIEGVRQGAMIKTH